ATLSAGRLFSAWDQAHRAQVCLVGAALAKAMGIARLDGRKPIYVDDVPCAVIGIVGQAPQQPALRRAVVLPSQTAVKLWGPPDEKAGAIPGVLIRTRRGAAQVVARQAPLAISQTRPHQFRVIVPAAPVRLRSAVLTAMTSLFYTLSWVSLGIGAFSIATVSWLSARER